MRTVFFDVDTQLDFLFPAGALAVPGAAQIAGQLKALTQAAAQSRITIVSTADAHGEDDPEFRTWPPHCVVGTSGQAKAAATSLAQAVTVPNLPVTAEALRAHIGSGQFIVQKQDVDCFTSHAIAPLLDALGAQRFVAYGLVAEICVAKAAFGLLQRGHRVELVINATKAQDEDAYRNVLAHFQAAGGTLTTTGEIIASVAA